MNKGRKEDQGKKDARTSREIHGELSDRLRESRRFEESGGRVRVAGAGRRSFLKEFFGGQIRLKVSREDIILFSRQLSMMLGIGIPVIQALQILSLRSPNPLLRKIIARIGSEVELGNPVSEALAQHPTVFNTFYVNTVRAGEQSGTADESLKLLADYMEKETRILRKFKSAMTYPVVALLIAVTVGILLVVKVIPVFEKVFADASQELPAITLGLIGFSRFIRGNYIILIAVIIGLYILMRFLRLSSGVRHGIDWFKLHVPRIGDIISRILIYRFARLMSIMSRSGVPIHQAMAITAEAVGNRVTRQALTSANTLINEGYTIEESLRRTSAFREIDVDIIGVGEQTGSLDTILDQMASAYEEDLQTLMENISVLIEPLMLLIIGGFVALIALSMFLPYFSLGSAILPQ
ncbi:type II secretion system F family protein [bacterium]|nr:type II secretion system F family protein [candidate division CSSED10-310 bacterium]